MDNVQNLTQDVFGKQFTTKTLLPFNISVLKLTDRDIQLLRPVTVLDIYDSTGVNFHDDGLFSVATFGRVGSEERDSRFGYIDLKTEILHPEIFLSLVSVRALYAGIIAGKTYAVFDPTVNDFLPASELQGQTGYSFFMSHWDRLTIPKNTSDTRNNIVDLIAKFKGQSTLRYHLVMPAGLRDVQVDDTGRTTEDEINDMYRKLITISNTLTGAAEDLNSAAMDTPRWALQYNAVLIYQHIKKLLSGKRGWFQKKFGSRRTRNGTRNVITAMDSSTAVLGAPDAPKATDTDIGFVQTLRGALPKTIAALKAGYLGTVIAGGEGAVWLTDPKTWTRTLVDLPMDVIDDYSTRAGLERLINRFFIPSLQKKPIRIQGYYLGLYYEDAETFKIFSDITELPSNLSKKNVRPITLADLLYHSTYNVYKTLYGLITRYPITGAGSIYPCTYRVRTTISTSTKYERDEAWDFDRTDETRTAYNYPDYSEQSRWVGSLGIPATRVALMGADRS